MPYSELGNVSERGHLGRDSWPLEVGTFGGSVNEATAVPAASTFLLCGLPDRVFPA